ncbi:MAG: aminotransferase class I/II-fold pyridoxal phosphate-dependent enzyme [Thermoanaerobaculales bacterium]|nr:aminotransferase class I/II-fold pyridoxal phosphate-dependent enzyme [Thermoanaerobaculales bacterium]
MRIPIFELERVQSIYENTVEFNLTESGFHPFTLNELLEPAQVAGLADTVLGYGQTNGAIPLRERIADLYANQSMDNVLVTNGSSEANFIACHTLVEPGDEVVMMVPNYMQIWGIVEEMGATPKAFHLCEDRDWAPDLEELRQQVSPKTKMIAVCNPNNPTGATLSEVEMREIVSIAEEVGAWVYADEVYRGAELDGVELPSFAGIYDRAMVAGGLSKAYALPGLRLGWLVGPHGVISDSWAYHDYTSITAGILSNRIAEIALSPLVRPRILERNRAMLRTNLGLTIDWVRSFGGVFHFVPPSAGGMAFVRYDLDINSTELSEWLRKEHSVFILAGDTFGMDRYFRLGIGSETAYLTAGLERAGRALRQRFGL